MVEISPYEQRGGGFSGSEHGVREVTNNDPPVKNKLSSQSFAIPTAAI